ncbi:MAG: RiPP maturation radical SAM C-methyltransferase [Pseudomonadota bacterium]
MIKGQTDIMLVNMPFVAIERPSLALGILSSLLRAGNINVTNLYANILFLKTIKKQDYILVEKIPPENSFGDWIFSGKVFPETNENSDDYINALIDNVPLFKRLDKATFKQRILTIREAGEAFVEEIARLVLSEKPRILACTSTFQQHLASLALLKTVKERNPDIITLIGGANCETIMGVATHKNFDFIDYVVSGEADDLIKPLVEAIIKYGINIPAEIIPYGVFAPLHRRSGYPGINKDNSGDGYPRADSQNLSKSPIPDYDDYFATLNSMPELKKSVISSLPVESSRGCFWGKCRFCGLNGSKDGQRIKPAERVLAEINTLAKRYGIDRIDMVDNVLHPKHLPDLFDKLTKQSKKYRIFYEVRTFLKRKDIELLHTAGVNWIQPGIESLHSKVLDIMKKGSSAWQNIQLLKWAGQYGIRSVWKIMFGFPDEQDEWYEEMAEIIPLLSHLEPPDAINQVRFDRYSEYCKHPDNFDLELKPFKSYGMVYRLKPADLMAQTYFFEDSNRSQKEATPLLANLIGIRSRNGLEMVRNAIRKWRTNFWDKNYERPALFIKEKNPIVKIVDTRPVTNNISVELDELQSSIYLACDAAKNPDKLRKLYKADGFSAQKFDSAIDYMLNSKIMLKIDNRILSLAFDEEINPLSEVEDCPLGLFNPAQEELCEDVCNKNGNVLIDNMQYYI